MNTNERATRRRGEKERGATFKIKEKIIDRHQKAHVMKGEARGSLKGETRSPAAFFFFLYSLFLVRSDLDPFELIDSSGYLMRDDRKKESRSIFRLPAEPSAMREKKMRDVSRERKTCSMHNIIYIQTERRLFYYS